jgi:hypothetical protein
MRWKVSNRADPIAVNIADRHYNRQKVGTPQFVPPGRCKVFLTFDHTALWVTSWPYAKYTKHAWAGAWVNSLFRNEGAALSSELILHAISATRYFWEPPEIGIVSFVNSRKIRSSNPGYCYLQAGFKKVGFTKKDKLVVLQMLPCDMPDPIAPHGVQLNLYEAHH